TALHAEREDRSRPLRHIALGPLVVRRIGEARVPHPRHPLVAREELRDRLRVRDVLLHPKRQGLEPDQEEERVERREARAEVAQLLDTETHAEPVLGEVLPEAQAVVGRDWLGHLREPARVPWEAAGLEDDAADRRA